MYDATMFTETDTGRPAPTYYQPFDGPRLFWRDDYWQRMQEVNSRADDTSVIVEVIETAKNTSNPFSRGTKSGTCVICEKPFSGGQPDQVTCGSERCKAARQKQRTGASDRRKVKKTMLSCPVCGKSFISTYRNKTQKTCGDPACTTEARSRAGKKAHEKEAA